MTIINNKLTFRNSDAQSIKDDYMSGNYTPIGISVVPFGHNLYGDNSCGVAALHILGKGGYYHVSKPSVTEIMNMGFTIYNGFLNGNNEEGTGEPSPFNPKYGDKTRRRIDYGKIASDYYTSIQCKHNPNKYYSTYETNGYPPYPLCPSVFLADGSKNTNAFLSFKPDNETYNNLMINSIADTDGRYNTYKILEPMPEKNQLMENHTVTLFQMLLIIPLMVLNNVIGMFQVPLKGHILLAIIKILQVL